jgi:hypothetical protein
MLVKPGQLSVLCCFLFCDVIAQLSNFQTDAIVANPEDWTRFSYYASHVRILHCPPIWINGDLLGALERRHLKDIPLFPNLTDLNFSVTKSIHLPLLQSLVSLELTAFGLLIYAEISP